MTDQDFTAQIANVRAKLKSVIDVSVANDKTLIRRKAVANNNSCLLKAAYPNSNVNFYLELTKEFNVSYNQADMLVIGWDGGDKSSSTLKPFITNHNSQFYDLGQELYDYYSSSVESKNHAKFN